MQQALGSNAIDENACIWPLQSHGFWMRIRPTANARMLMCPNPEPRRKDSGLHEFHRKDQVLTKFVLLLFRTANP